MHGQSLLLPAFAVAHTPLQLLVGTFLDNLAYPGMTAFPFLSSVMAGLKHLNFSWVWVHTLL